MIIITFFFFLVCIFDKSVLKQGTLSVIYFSFLCKIMLADPKSPLHSACTFEELGYARPGRQAIPSALLSSITNLLQYEKV